MTETVASSESAEVSQPAQSQPTTGLVETAQNMTGASFTETGLNQDQNTEITSEAAANEKLTDIIPGDGVNPLWFWKDGVEGEGERPPYLLEKYDNVEGQAKAYVDSQKMLGSFKGAPEEYEIEVPEHLEGTIDIDINAKSFKEFEEFAKENNMSQEIFEKITNFHLEAINDTLSSNLSEEQLLEYNKGELEKLGSNGPQMVEHLTQWGKNNLSSDEFEVFRRFGDSAESVRVLRSIINKSNTTSISPDAQIKPSLSSKDLSSAIMSEEYRNDKQYRKDIDSAYMNMYGNNK